MSRRADAQERVRGALALGLGDLDETTRIVLALRHVEGLSVEETALALSLPALDVERAEERARAHLVHRVHHRAGHEGAGLHDERREDRAA